MLCAAGNRKMKQFVSNVDFKDEKCAISSFDNVIGNTQWLLLVSSPVIQKRVFQSQHRFKFKHLLAYQQEYAHPN